MTDPVDPAPHPPASPVADRVELTARNLRGIAHPVRVRLLWQLREAGPATATMLAERLGLNTGATSYHLRQLATYGFVVEEAGRGTSRERWWRAAHSATWIDQAQLAGEEAAMGSAFLRSVAEVYTARMLHAVDSLPGRPADWHGTTVLSDYFLQLTPDETRALIAEVAALLARHPRAGTAAPPVSGAGQVAFQIQVFPVEEGPTAAGEAES